MKKPVTKNTEKQAVKLMRQKLDLEKLFEPDIISYFNLAKQLVKRGDPLNTIQPFLKLHTNRIINTIFKGHDQPLIKSKVTNSLEKTIKQHSKLIDKTTAKVLKQSQKDAKDLAKDSEIKAAEWGEKAESSTVANIFAQRNKGRVQGIVTSETTNLHNKVRAAVMVNSVPVLKEIMDKNDPDMPGEWENTLKDIDGLNDNETITEAVSQYRDHKSVVAIIGFIKSSKRQWVCRFENSCEVCEALDGEIVDYDEDFPGGEEPGWVHTNCQCSVIYVWE